MLATLTIDCVLSGEIKVGGQVRLVVLAMYYLCSVAQLDTFQALTH